MTPTAPPRDLDGPPATDLRTRSSGISATAIEVRKTRVKLTPTSLRQEHLSKLQLTLIPDMMGGGINTTKIATVSDCARVIEVLDVLQVSARER